MKKLYALLAMLLFVGSAFAQVLVNETFETGNTVGQTPVGWICSDDGWKAGITIPDDNEARGRKPHTGDWYMYASYNSDVWIYKAIDVTAGNYYRVSFWYATWHVDHFDLEVKAGTSASPSAMTINVVPQFQVANEEFEQTSGVFQATNTGTCYVGFHSTANNFAWYLSIDDVIIEHTDLINFSLEQLTPDTSVYFGEPAYLRFLLNNTGQQSDTYSFTGTGTLPMEFYQNGAQVTSVAVPYNEAVELVAKTTLPMNLTNNQELHATFNVTSTTSGLAHGADFKITALEPVTSYPLMEGFENDFVPFGWQNNINSGTYAYDRITSGSTPTAMPHEESQYMARFYTYTNPADNSADLVSPKLTLNATDNIVTFWVFRNSNHNINKADRFNVYYNTEPKSEGGQLLGTIHRCTFMEPVVADEDDWYEYSFTFNSPTGYGFVIFEAVSGYGWNLYLDDITINTTIVDDLPPTLISLKGTQEYADTEMNLRLRAYDATGMPSSLNAVYTIDGTSHNITFNQAKGNSDYVATIPAQPNHTTGSLVVTLVDDLGNSADTDPIALHWDWQRPLLYETFEECDVMSLPEGWTRDGNPTWFDWYVEGTVYYTDYYYNDFVVTPHSGNRQAVLEWDDTEEPVAQDQTLISPVIPITEPTVLTFWTWAQYGTDGYDHFVARVYDCYNGTWEDKWDVADMPSGQINAYQEPISINLDSYIGHNIKIGFRGFNTYGETLAFDWFIDDVKVIITDTVSGPNVGVIESLADNDVQLYPNPVKDQLHIDSKSRVRQMEMVTPNGVMIESRKIVDYAVDCHLEGYSKGVYFIRLITDEGVITKKIVLE